MGSQVENKAIPVLERVPIDELWSSVIHQKEEFNILGSLVRSTLCFFHANHSVEGSINDLRNALGDRSHGLNPETVAARLAMKSAVTVSKTCCSNYRFTGEHRE